MKYKYFDQKNYNIFFNSNKEYKDFEKRFLGKKCHYSYKYKFFSNNDKKLPNTYISNKKRNVVDWAKYYNPNLSTNEVLLMDAIADSINFFKKRESFEIYNGIVDLMYINIDKNDSLYKIIESLKLKESTLSSLINIRFYFNFNDLSLNASINESTKLNKCNKIFNSYEKAIDFFDEIATNTYIDDEYNYELALKGWLYDTLKEKSEKIIGLKFFDFYNSKNICFESEEEYDNYCLRAKQMGVNHLMAYKNTSGNCWSDYMNPKLSIEDYYTLDSLLSNLDVFELDDDIVIIDGVIDFCYSQFDYDEEADFFDGNTVDNVDIQVSLNLNTNDLIFEVGEYRKEIPFDCYNNNLYDFSSYITLGIDIYSELKRDKYIKQKATKILDVCDSFIYDRLRYDFNIPNFMKKDLYKEIYEILK